MAYRDELTAAQARVSALERELAQTREKLAMLEAGRSPGALVRAGPTALVRGASGSPAARSLLGAPTRLEFSRDLDGELPESAHTEMVEHIRRVLGNVGTVSRLPGSLAWQTSNPYNGVGPFVSAHVTVRDDTTTIRVEETLGNLAGAIFGGLGGGVGGGGLGAVIPISITMLSPLLVGLAIPLWLGGTYAACRRLYRNRARSRAERLEWLLDDLCTMAEKHIAGSG